MANAIRPETKAVDRERKHLEGLLKDRINFHLLFASVFMLGLSRIEDVRIKAWALFTISVVSLLMALAVLRTHRLVQLALIDIRLDDNHPYTQYWKKLRAGYCPIVPWRWNANWILIFVPFMLTLFFACVTIFYFYVMFSISGHSSDAI